MESESTQPSYRQFSAVVGAAQQPSQLTAKTLGGGVLLVANAGGDGGAIKGADGYSGILV